MGRKAPDSIYDFETCYPQTYVTEAPTGANYTGSIKPGYDSSPLTQGHDVVVALPIGATGSAVTGCTIVGQSSGRFEPNSFYPNNGLVFINDEGRAIINTSVTDSLNALSVAGDTNTFRYLISPNLNQDIYRPAVKSTSTTTGYISGTPSVLKVTGVSDSNKNVSGGYAISHVKLHSNYGLLTFYKNSNTISSGRAVSCSLIDYTTTGFNIVTGLTLEDTVNSGATSGCFCVPTVAKDFSYTGGTVSRVLIGYQSDTGVTSGQLCAQVLEISGTTLTTGDPVVIRSVSPVGSQNYVNFINATHHFNSAQNAFVIATAVRQAGGTFTHISGELVAATPASGVVLSGTFGTPVPIMNSTGSTSGCSQPVCTALNTFTGVESYGVVIAQTGNLTATGLLQRQTYEVNGNTITTGVIIQSGVVSLVSPNGGIVNAQYDSFGGGSRFPILGTGFFVNPKISEISSNLTTSGLICHIGYGQLINSSGHVLSGTCYINMVHVPYSLSSTGVTQYTTINCGTSLSGNTSTQIRNKVGLNFPTDLPFFEISGNPYSGIHGSYIELVSPITNYIMGLDVSNLYVSGLGFTTLKTTTGYFPSGNINPGIFGGIFFTGSVISGASNMSIVDSYAYAGYALRSAYCLTTGNSSQLPSIGYSFSNIQQGGTSVILSTLGTYPNITGLVMWYGSTISGINGTTQVAVYDVSLPSITGEQLYTRNLDMFKTPVIKDTRQNVGANGGTTTGLTYYTYPTENIGVVVNANTGDVDNRFTLTSGVNYFTTGEVIVKVAKTEKAKRNLIKTALGQYTITESKTIFE